MNPLSGTLSSGIDIVSAAPMNADVAVLAMSHTLEAVTASLVPGVLVLELEIGPGKAVAARYFFDSLNSHSDTQALKKILKSYHYWVEFNDALTSPRLSESAQWLYEFRPEESTRGLSPLGVPSILLYPRSDDETILLRVSMESSSFARRGEHCVGASVVITGTSPHMDVVAALVAADSIDGYKLVPKPLRAEPPALHTFPRQQVAALLSAPLRIPGLFPNTRPRDADELRRLSRSSPSPHMLVVGQSGSGKTSLLVHLADDAVKHGESFVFVDAHDGQAAADAFEACRRRSIVPRVLSFADPKKLTPLAIAHAPLGLSNDHWALELYSVIRNLLWGDMPSEYFGPVGQRVLRLAIKAIVSDTDANKDFCNIVKLFDPGDEGQFRSKLLARIGDADLVRDFKNEVERMVRDDSSNAVSFFTSKFEPFVASPVVQRAFGGSTPPNFDDVFEGRPLIVHAPSTLLGDEGSRTVIGYVLHVMWLGAQRRTSRSNVHIFCDEWQKYPVPSLPSMWAEGRKFGLWLRLANQSLHQIPPRLRAEAMTNMGTIAAFRTGSSDATILEPFYPTLTVRQLATLGRHEMAVVTADEDFRTTAPLPLESGSIADLTKKHRFAQGSFQL